MIAAGLAPRSLVLTGRHVVHGLVIDVALLGASEARARVMAAWCPGASVSQLGDDEILVLWPEPRPAQVEALLGAAVIAREGAWCTLPLDAREWEALAPVPQDAVVRARGGVVEVLTQARAVVDPARWIDLGEVVALDATSLGAPPRPIEAPSVVAPVALRERLLPPGAREAPPDAAKVLAALRRSHAQGAEDVEPARPRPTWREALRAWWRTRASAAGQQGGTARAQARSSLWSRVRGWLSGAKTAQLAASTERTDQRTPGRARPSWWSRLRAWMGGGARAAVPPSDRVAVRDDEAPAPNPIARALRRLSRYLQMLPWAGGQSARYLTEMLDKFERGDLTEALRHAIPLGDGTGEGESEPAFGTPQPRDALDISTGARAARGSLFASDDLYAHLRRLYRGAFERLEREGKIAEAAFVLAELLGQSEEAVAFLERHKQHRLAAELAEGRKLDPALVVRQWLLAGETDRAVSLAREHGVFAAAIARLDRGHPEQARRLRLIWADLQADAGDFAGAVEIVWPLADARPLASAWIDRAIAVGGVTGARMIAKKVLIDPAAYGVLLPKVVELSRDPDPSAGHAREALGRGLLESSSDSARHLAHVVVRALLRDRGTGASTMSGRDLRALAKHARDGALEADIPDAAVGAPPAGPVHFALTVDARDVGRTPLFDAARLPNGQLLVACGEGGVRWVTRQGKPVAHFDVPAHRLVVSDHGDRVLALAPRGSVVMVSKIDLRERRSIPWLELELAGSADTFDGAVWYVLERHAVVALDLLTRRPTAVWRVAVEGHPVHVARDPANLVFAVDDGEHHEVWAYQLPTVTLRARRRHKRGEACVVGANGTSAVLREGVLDVSNAMRSRSHPELSYERLVLGTRGELCAVLRGADRMEAHVHEGSTQLGKVVLGGGADTFVRMQSREILIGDRAGRLVVRSLDDAARRLDLRL